MVPGYQFHNLLDLLYGPSKEYRLEITPLSAGRRAVQQVVVAARSPGKRELVFVRQSLSR